MNRVSSNQALKAPPRAGHKREMCRAHRCVKDGIDFGSPTRRPSSSFLDGSKGGRYIVKHDWSVMLDSDGNQVGGPVSGSNAPRLSETRQEDLIRAMR